MISFIGLQYYSYNKNPIRQNLDPARFLGVKYPNPVSGRKLISIHRYYRGLTILTRCKFAELTWSFLMVAVSDDSATISVFFCCFSSRCFAICASSSVSSNVVDWILPTIYRRFSLQKTHHWHRYC